MQEATPLTSVTPAQPVMTVLPSLNSTSPAGVPVPGASAATVAVSETGALKGEGFVADPAVVVVVGLGNDPAPRRGRFGLVVGVAAVIAQ